MSALGVLGGLIGLPTGVAAHHLIVPISAAAANDDFRASMVNVWSAPRLCLPALAGIVIAVFGALVPASSAARLTIAKVLYNE
ncbi:hypothetical protein [Streptomyces mirabilis]|uniref:hypothetical protein n=1 Tax=Streptomyces mirabilis TaxID=68239 RepID=UPI0034160B5F